ncbi:hypothetical protein ACWENS_10440 [Streptomyces sp. NPDC004532]
MTAIDTVRSVVSHRGMSVLDLHRLIGQLRRDVRILTPRAEQATALEGRIDEQAKTIGSLREQLVQAKGIRDDVHAKAGRYDEAEARARKAERELKDQTSELRLLRSLQANAHRIDVPAPFRDNSDPEDQATVPVRTLPQAFGIGPVRDPGRLH